MSTPTAIVTGASRGIGRAIAVGLAKAGWHVIVNYHRDAAAADGTRAAAQAEGAKATAVRADISRPEDRQALVDAALEETGQVNLLVNNAGMAPRHRVDILEASLESFREVLATNLEGPYFLTQLVARAMIEQVRSGLLVRPAIVNIGSISATHSSTQRGEYCISKAGMGMVTMLWADRLAEYGIGVYEIRPGIIETDLTAVVHDKYEKLIAETRIVPMRRWGYPSDVAKIVLAIAEGALPFSTGEIIYVDGGLHIQRL